jgi:hypothetical protein
VGRGVYWRGRGWGYWPGVAAAGLAAGAYYYRSSYPSYYDYGYAYPYYSYRSYPYYYYGSNYCDD